MVEATTTDDQQAALDEEFKAYALYLQDHKEEAKKSQSRETLLSMYAHARQGKDGDNTEKKPGMLDIPGKMKHSAWLALKGMDRNEAKKKLIEIAKGVFGDIRAPK